MRPVALHMQGFGAFREPVDVSFDDVDYFALVGPTGAGKSTVVDAICFALYGSVPRYGDERLVSRAVSAGKQEAKVSLTFDIGERRYRATRVVRVRDGKTKTDALLERVTGDDVSELLANSARDMKPAVEQLIGLPFAHFTKCVVLPQGDFARFLHDEPAKRRELLSRLLDFQVYDRVGQRARERASEAGTAVTLYTQQLAALDFATDAAQRTTLERRDALRDLYKRLDLAYADDERDAAALATLVADHGRAIALANALQQITTPAELATFTDDLAAARRTLDDAERERAESARELSALDTRLTDLGDAAPLVRAKDAHDAAARVRTDLDTATEARVHTEERLGAATASADDAETAATAAEEALAAQRDAHAAHALASHLVAGEPCPVCAQNVGTVPKRKKPGALSTAERALTTARTRAAAARKELADATAAAAGAAARRDQLLGQLEEYAALLAAHPDRASIDAQLLAHAQTASDHAAARAREHQARERAQTARDTLATFDARGAQWAKALQRARDVFVAGGLEPPHAGGDLARDWSAFAQWAATAHDDQRAVVAALDVQLAGARDQQSVRTAEFVAACEAVGLRVRGSDLGALRDAVHEAGTTVATELRRIEDALEQRGKLDEQLAAARAEHEVAAMLGSLMRSNRFENWLLAEAVERLAETASTTLFALSDGHFSLSYSDDSEFDVIDHRNAGERRSVRTLSGGETFQASLALALALREQLAELSTAGSAKLDALFLDEGFGTLDADSLEVVAGTIETLGARGGMVGIVTHVPSLAERVPIRYRVENAGSGARVVREDV